MGRRMSSALMKSTPHPGVEPDDGIVVRLGSGARHFEARTYRCSNGTRSTCWRSGGMDRGAFHRRVPRYGLPRNAAHDMNAELQAERVHIVGQRLKTLPIGRRGKPVDGRNQPAVFVHVEMRLGIVPAGARVGSDHWISTTMLLPAREEAGASTCNRRWLSPCASVTEGAIAVPTVPAHWRGAGKRHLVRAGSAEVPGWTALAAHTTSN